MSGFLLGVFSAFWLGILTSISPCPLATNVAAVSFIGRRIERARMVFLTGLFYTLGRMLTYVLLGILIVASVMSIQRVSNVLQEYMNKILGIVLILVGMVLLGLLRINLPGSGVSERVQKRAESWGIWGAGVLGIVFALAFCPVSAALFFGSLIPLSVKYNSSIALPAVYGLGTGLPVFLFAILIALGVQTLAKAFNKLTQIEWWVSRLTGVVFIVVGVYFCLAYVFHVVP
ncbi:MAG: aromatic aminobenezylarsenical efflux permease ArsG family transporter [Candidatus Eisenbacteria bacterium]|nr:aromatic aminobenezylarsenical efflux permease ArsG family transporter [Candidatus Eisenbacteria bacterium]